MKKFDYEVIESWIWWAKIYRKEEVSREEAMDELKILQDFVEALKNYPR